MYFERSPEIFLKNGKTLETESVDKKRKVRTSRNAWSFILDILCGNLSRIVKIFHYGFRLKFLKFQSFKIKPLRNNFCPLSYIYYFFKELKLSFPALIMRTDNNILNIRLEARSEFEGSVNFEMKKQHSNK